MEAQALQMKPEEEMQRTKLTVISEEGKNKHGMKLVRCRCECGNEKTVILKDLLRGHTRSCGCIQTEGVRRLKMTHGLSHTPTHNTWRGMVERCRNRNHQMYRLYGGRGIKVCERWLTFGNFLADMGEKPIGRSLDRINNNGNYEPENCRWATRLEQARNASTNRLLTYNGKTQNVPEWAEEIGMLADTLHMRLHRGWPTDRALTTPLRKPRRTE